MHQTRRVPEHHRSRIPVTPWDDNGRMLLEEMTAYADGLQVVARDVDADLCDGPDAAEFMVQAGRITRYTAAITGPMSKRVDETQAYVVHGDRSAAEFCARIMGVWTSEAKRQLENAARLEADYLAGRYKRIVPPA